MAREIPVLALTVLLALPGIFQTSRPVSGATSGTRPGEANSRARDPDFGPGAPGPKVVPVKFLPINSAPYSKPDAKKYPLRGVALVIGFERDGTARAYPA